MISSCSRLIVLIGLVAWRLISRLQIWLLLEVVMIGAWVMLGLIVMGFMGIVLVVTVVVYAVWLLFTLLGVSEGFVSKELS